MRKTHIICAKSWAAGLWELRSGGCEEGVGLQAASSLRGTPPIYHAPLGSWEVTCEELQV